MTLRLRALIRQVRSCHDQSEEKSVILKEAALIRSDIRNGRLRRGFLGGKRGEELQRQKNVSKLLYMHMLGYPTHFAQLECLKLLASTELASKKMGYLGLMVLLPEDAEIMMLSTNCLKNDLMSEDKRVVGLALCAVGNVATADMCRDLVHELDRLLSVEDRFTRQKCCLAMCRCITKAPYLIEKYVDRMENLLSINDGNKDALRTVLQLMTQMLFKSRRTHSHNTQPEDQDDDSSEQDQENFVALAQNSFLPLAPTLADLLRRVLDAAKGHFDTDSHSYLSDCFLQVQILTVLRLIHHDIAQPDPTVMDAITRIATETDASRYAGNAVLYECMRTVTTIISLQWSKNSTTNQNSTNIHQDFGEEGRQLRVLAINIIGRFLLNRDNNIRYVALNTLAEFLSSGQDHGASSFVERRHRATLVDCLVDPDDTIRHRAMELVYLLIDQDNVQSMTIVLLRYLQRRSTGQLGCPREKRPELCRKILRIVQKYRHTVKEACWSVDVLLTLLTIAGRECGPDVQNEAIACITQASEKVRLYAAHRLLKGILDNHNAAQLGLLMVGVWCTGEYGDLLLKHYSYAPPSSFGNLFEVDAGYGAAPDALGGGYDDAQSSSDAHNNTVNQEEGQYSFTVSFLGLEPAAVVTAVENITKLSHCPIMLHQRAVTCLTKLSDRYKGVASPAVAERMQKLVQRYNSSPALELQVRSCEYQQLMRLRNAESDKLTSGEDDKGNAAKVLARMPVVDLSKVPRRNPMGGGQSDVEQIAKKPENNPKGDIGVDLFDLNENSSSQQQVVDSLIDFGTEGTNASASNNNGTSTQDQELLLLDASASTSQPQSSAIIQGNGQQTDLFAMFADDSKEMQPASCSLGDDQATKSLTTTTVPSNELTLTGTRESPTSVSKAMNGSGPDVLLDLFSNGTADDVKTAKNVDLINSQQTPSSDLLLPDIDGASSLIQEATLSSRTTSASSSVQPSDSQIPSNGTSSCGSDVSNRCQETICVFDEDGLVIHFECSRKDPVKEPQTTNVEAFFTNNTSLPFENVNLLCAVPKYVTMEILPASSTTIPPKSTNGGDKVMQKITFANGKHGKKKLLVKIKVSFAFEGQEKEHVATVSNFPDWK